MYRYETHMHTAPVSRCARATVRENLEFYKSLGYDGVFITNHFLRGNINIERALPYAERLAFYFSDYEEAIALAEEIGIKVFLGVEITVTDGTDFLIFGLGREWYFAHPEIEAMKASELLSALRDAGALVVQAHPFRQAAYIDHIHLFPDRTEAVEVYNACRTELENTMAELYAEKYGFLRTAGTDNHVAGARTTLGGMEFNTPLHCEADFVTRVRSGEGHIFKLKLETES